MPHLAVENCADVSVSRVVRASLGAMSTRQDVDRLLAFLHDTFIARQDSAYASSNGNVSAMSCKTEHLDGAAVRECECLLQTAA